MMLDDLTRSGLDAKDAAAMHLVPMRSATAYGADVPAYGIPYFDLRGAVLPGAPLRARFLKDPPRVNLSKKVRRYSQLAGTEPHLYLAPHIEWDDAAQDTRIAVYVTEGEKKAAKACKEGIPTIGLGGVWSWRTPRQGLPMLAEFGLFEWKRRRVLLCFDSDLRTNANVQWALVALCRTLTDVGAEPCVVWLPSGPNGEKVGLDDYLVARGAEAFLAIEPEPFQSVQALWQFNEEFAVVVNPPCVIESERSTLLAPNQFALLTANRLHMVQVPGPGGQITMRQVKTAKVWLEWPGRRQHPSVVYEPGESEVTATGEYNMWRPPAVTPEPMPQEYRTIFQKLLQHLFHRAPEAIAWFLQWCAYPLQHPGAKLASAVLIHGPTQGTGKSLLGVLLGSCYGHNFHIVKSNALFQPFNQWAVGHQLILMDEVVGGDRRRDADLLKSLVTSPTIEINRKHVPQYVIRDHLNYLFTSNHPDAIYIDDYDRRYLVVRCDAKPMDETVYVVLGKWLTSGLAARHLLHEFTQVIDVSTFNPNARPPMTEAKTDLVHYTRSTVDQWVYELLGCPDATLKMDNVVLEGDLWSASDLAALRAEHRSRGEDIAIGRALMRYGRPSIHLGKYGRRVYPIRNPEHWYVASTEACWKHYAETRKITWTPLAETSVDRREKKR